MTTRQNAILQLSLMSNEEFQALILEIERLAPSKAQALEKFYKRIVPETLCMIENVYVWHVIAYKSKFNKFSVRIRRLRWQSYITAILGGANAEMYFFYEEQAVNKKNELLLEAQRGTEE